MARARFVAAGALALALCAAPSAGAAETLGLDPEKVRPGGGVTATDEGFVDPEGTDLELPLACTVSLDGKEVSDLCEIDKTGALQATFAVPEDMKDGEYQVEVEAGDLSATAKLTVSQDAPEHTVDELGPDRGEHVISTPAGRSDENGTTPVYILVMVAVGTLGVIVFRTLRSKNPQDPFAPSYRPATGKGPKPAKPPKPAPGEQKPPPPKLNIPPPPAKKGGGRAPAPASGPAPAGPAPVPAGADGVPAAADVPGLRLLARPDTGAQVVLLDLDAPA